MMVDTIVGAVHAELLKFRRRPAHWVVIAIHLSAVVLFGYVLNYAIVTAGQPPPGSEPEAVLATLLPASLPVTALNQIVGFGLPIVLILAVLMVASEYAWGTWKTMAVQRPTRSTLLTGKILTLAVTLAILVVATFLVAWAASLVVAGTEGASLAGPPPAELLGGILMGWAILAPYALLGVLLAVTLRSTGLALGLGLTYVMVVENLLLTVPLGEGLADAVVRLGLGPNALALSQVFGEPASGMQMTVTGAHEAPQAVLVLAIYLLAFFAISLTVFRRRSVA